MSDEIFTVCSCGEDHYNELLSFWEAVVCGSGFFRETADIQFYKSLLYDKYFPAACLFAVRTNGERIVALMGISDDLIGMLLVAPGERRKGYGKRLLDFAVHDKQVKRGNVYEWDEQTLHFYLGQGFDVTGRETTDFTGRSFPVLYLELVRPLSSRLSVRFHMEDIQAILCEIRYNETRREELYRLIYDEDDIVAYQALWVCSHFSVSGQTWLQEKQNELIEEVLACPHAGKRRILLQLLEKQSYQQTPRVDFLDFCLEHMLAVQELPGVQSLCIKLACKLCRPFPELLQEFKAMLELADRNSLSAATKSVIRNTLKKMPL